jgi:death-on-curing protein
VPEPIQYLTAENIVQVYAAIFHCSDQQARDQVRDWNALEGAVARPASYAFYQDADLALQAAVLAHGVAETQPFVEGNKRTALEAMRTFLRLNGYQVIAPPLMRARWIIELSSGGSLEDLAEKIRSYSELIR